MDFVDWGRCIAQLTEGLKPCRLLCGAAAASPTAPRLVFVPNQYGLGNRLRALYSVCGRDAR